MYRTKKVKMTKVVTIREPDIPAGYQLITTDHCQRDKAVIDNKNHVIYINPADYRGLPMREKTLLLPRSFTFKGIKKGKR